MGPPTHPHVFYLPKHIEKYKKNGFLPARPADLTYLHTFWHYNCDIKTYPPDITIGIGQFHNSCDVFSSCLKNIFKPFPQIKA